MIGNIKLKPSSRSPYVRIRFYGGPRDGEATQCVTASELKGHIDSDATGGWHYSFVGFMDDRHVPPSMLKFAMESAVYEWTK